ncbi:MAG: DNA-directed polymerase specialized sigma subunit, sigma24 [Phycisphaerales bacterium]|nr:DNA-directed polymerase specialized sigma subunit, sigma24 [Phycisphaerales bacterium]
MADADESALTRRFVGGDPEAFDAIVARYQVRVARLAHRLLGWGGDPDDVVQDVFLTALRKSGGFRGRSSLWTWLATITINRCRRQLRRKALWRRFLFSSRQAVTDAAAAADRDALETETARRVRESVAALPAADREVIVLYYMEECSVAEISELLGATPNAVQVRLHRARARLSAALADFMKE